MKDIVDFVMAHATRGACTCGKCADALPNPEQHQPSGHTVDMIFFKVAKVDEPDKEEFIRLTKEHTSGYVPNFDPWDGKEHNYLEVGAWIGDQGLGLMYIALGNLMGLWNVLTPVNVLALPPDHELVRMLAGQGYISLQAAPAEARK